MAKRRTRVVLTSGGLEPVADSGSVGHSPFAGALIKTLERNDVVMDATQLISEIRRPVVLPVDQTPQYSDARRAGHDSGTFLFVRR